MVRTSRLLGDVRRALSEVGDPERARGAQAYMKSEMPFHGVGAVPLRAICRRLFAGLELPDAAAFRDEVFGVFRGARYREELYAAVGLARLKRAAPLRDLALLHACIEPSVEAKEFFLRKAIGWALRQHARTDPDGVRRYVAENAGRLSGLSKREACRHLG